MSLHADISVSQKGRCQSSMDYVGSISPCNLCWTPSAEVRKYFENGPKITLMRNLSVWLQSTPEECFDTGIIALSIYMIGPCKEAASPTICFISESKVLRTGARRSYKRSNFVEAFPGFRTAEMPRDPGCDQRLEQLTHRQAVRADVVSGLSSPEACYDQSISLQSAMPIYIRGSSFISAGTANAIQIEGKTFFLAPCNILFNEKRRGLMPEPRSDEGFEIDTDDMSEPEDDKVRSTSRISNTDSSFARSSIQEYGPVTSGASYNEKPGATETNSSDVVKSVVLAQPDTQRRTGFRIFDSVVGSMPQETITSALDMLRPLGTVVQWSYNQDWALIEPVEEVFFDTTDTVLQSVRKLCSADIAEPESDMRVVIQTGSRDCVRGTITDTVSYMRLPRSKLFEQVHLVKLDRPLYTGDCGSFVMEAGSNKLLGHVIAGYQSTGLAYMICARSTIYRLSKRKQELLDLPSKQELLDLPKPNESLSSCGTSNSRDETTPNCKTDVQLLTPEQHNLVDSGFSYPPLESDCIRILFLWPEYVSPDGELFGDLFPRHRRNREHVDIPFRPLSYTWGQEEATSVLFLANSAQFPVPEQWAEQDAVDAFISTCDTHKAFPIRPNLEKALRQLRHHRYPVILWVDAICINQGDYNEKNHQVWQMDGVYRGRDVLIWIGEEKDNSQLAVDMMEEWERICQQDLIAEDIPTEDLAHMMQQARRKFLGSGFSSKAHWQALWDLINRPWFSRRWIVQECVVSNPNKIFQVGDRQFTWDLLTALIASSQKLDHPWNAFGIKAKTSINGLCMQDPYNVHLLPPLKSRDESIKHLESACNDYKNNIRASLTLEKLLERFCSFESSDPKDGVYAFLSIATDIEQSEWKPDYSPQVAVEDIYAKATEHIIQHSRSLDILGRSSRVTVFEGTMDKSGNLLPCWAPWFGVRSALYNIESIDHGRTVHLHQHLGYNPRSLINFGLPSWEQGAVYAASGKGAQAQAQPLEHAELSVSYPPLKIKGYLVDTVKRVGGTSGIAEIFHSVGDNTSGMHVGSIPDAWAEMLGGEQWPPNEVPDEFCRAITGNRLLINSDETATVTQVPDNWVSSTREYVMGFRDGLYELELPDFFPSAIEKQISDSMNVMLSDGRQFAITDKSMGFVPKIAKPGCAIIILPGCSIPLAARVERIDAAAALCVILGECYVDGIMEGGAMQEDKAVEFWIV